MQNKSGAEKNSADEKLWTWLTFLFGLGALAIWGSHLDFHWIQDEPVVAEFLRDLGIAFWVSVTIATIIERDLSRRTFLSGLDAIMMRTVPERVWQEFRQHVIGQTTKRNNYVVKMSISESGDVLESETTISYTLESLIDGLDEKVRHELDAHRIPLTGDPFKRAKIGGTEYANLRKLTSEGYVHDHGLTLAFPFISDLKKTIDVEFTFAEIFHVPDSAVFWMSRTTETVTLIIEKMPSWLNAEPRTAHPAGQLRLVDANKKWVFSFVMLPGQGFEIRFTRKDA